MLIYNSQTHKKEEFIPAEKGRVRMYVCGPTVYDQIHIGNARTFLSFDTIRRYLQYKGYEVVFAQNLTDVDDKIINRANENGVEASEIARTYSNAFIEQMHRFNILDPDIRPRATQEIHAMQTMIQTLIANKCAYVADNGDVYFSVRSDASYGTVSGRNLDDLRAGERVEVNDAKRDPFDFALWKAAKPGEPAWDSPWGAGRPGWHTECCAMIHHYLDAPIDIHGGGQDLMFPHHENENAQSVCAWSQPLAHYWMHTGMLRVDGEKMSKSLGNFYTLKDVLDTYSADEVRLLMLQTHYRAPLDFSFERLKGAQGTLARIKSCVKNLRWAAEHDSEGAGVCAASDAVAGATGAAGAVDGGDADAALEFDSAFGRTIDKAQIEFVQQMDDDFNAAGALAAIFNLVAAANKYLDAAGARPSVALALRAADMLCELCGVLGIALTRPVQQDLPSELLDVARELADYEGDDIDAAQAVLLSARAAARSNKDWARADAIRDKISALGLVVEDTAAGTRIKRKE